MPRLENAGGDRLARGAASHTFRPMGEKLSREAWDGMFAGETEPVIKAVYILDCPVHGTYVTPRECFVSGGFPQLDENLVTKCKIDGCGEKAIYAGHEIVQEDDSDSDCEPTGTSSVNAGEFVEGPHIPEEDIPF